MTHTPQWLQERADLLATLTQWRERAEKAEAKVAVAKKGFDDIANFCGDEPGAARASLMATVAKWTLKSMEDIDE